MVIPPKVVANISSGSILPPTIAESYNSFATPAVKAVHIPVIKASFLLLLFLF